MGHLKNKAWTLWPMLVLYGSRISIRGAEEAREKDWEVPVSDMLRLRLRLIRLRHRHPLSLRLIITRTRRRKRFTRHTLPLKDRLPLRLRHSLSA